MARTISKTRLAVGAIVGFVGALSAYESYPATARAELARTRDDARRALTPLTSVPIANSATTTPQEVHFVVPTDRQWHRIASTTSRFFLLVTNGRPRCEQEVFALDGRFAVHASADGIAIALTPSEQAPYCSRVLPRSTDHTWSYEFAAKSNEPVSITVRVRRADFPPDARVVVMLDAPAVGDWLEGAGLAEALAPKIFPLGVGLILVAGWIVWPRKAA